MMAQYSIKSHWFEQHWRPRRNLAAKVLRDIEDSWLPSERPFPCEETAAILLNIFAFDFHKADFLWYTGVRPDDLWARSLDGWFSSVSAPESECIRLAPKRDREECRRIVESLCAILRAAADSWENVSPRDPSCDGVVEDVIEELVGGRFVVMKYD
jgi:hypothetical protein